MVIADFVGQSFRGTREYIAWHSSFLGPRVTEFNIATKYKGREFRERLGGIELNKLDFYCYSKHRSRDADGVAEIEGYGRLVDGKEKARLFFKCYLGNKRLYSRLYDRWPDGEDWQVENIFFRLLGEYPEAYESAAEELFK